MALNKMWLYTYASRGSKGEGGSMEKQVGEWSVVAKFINIFSIIFGLY
jgi:hypothetical protein